MAAGAGMIRGLGRFQTHFATHTDQYVLIGGSAATLTMAEAGLPFRATKDLDIVLHVEALTPAFVEAFWAFVKAGGYAVGQRSDGAPQFYRFQKPADVSYPAMLELFSRKPDGLTLAGEAHLTPIPVDEAVSSLSAILLNEDYYVFVMAGRRETNGLVWVGEDRLIPLKASAWLDLSQRAAQGAVIDSKAIRKHLNDVLRLSQVLTPATRIDVPAAVGEDLRRFIAALRVGEPVDLKSLGIAAASTNEICDRLAQAYGLA